MLSEVFILAQQATDDEAIRYEIVTGRRAPWNNPPAAGAGQQRPHRPGHKKGGR